jgi:succinoglycan biosynthesis protein ExoA
VSDRPHIDVVVPAFNEEGAIDACLDAVLAQDYPADRMQVFVIDAGSEDRTVDVVRARAARDPRIVLLSGDGRLNAGQAFQIGFQAGRAPLVARIDAHAYPDPDYLARAADVFASDDGKLGALGGGLRHVARTSFGRAAGIARQTRFGVGNSVFAERRDRVEVDTVPLPVFRRAALDDVGGFLPALFGGEDEEVNWRLKGAGWKVLLDRSLRIRYEQRSSWSALFRQYRHYGHSRARVVALHPDYVRPRHLAPGALVLVGSALALAGLVSRRARRANTALFLAYAASTIVSAGRAAREAGEPALGPQVAAAYVAIHGGYGLGLVEGTAHIASARLGIGELRTTVRAR